MPWRRCQASESRWLTFVTAFLRGPDGSLMFRPNPFAGSDRVGGGRARGGPPHRSRLTERVHREPGDGRDPAPPVRLARRRPLRRGRLRAATRSRLTAHSLPGPAARGAAVPGPLGRGRRHPVELRGRQPGDLLLAGIPRRAPGVGVVQSLIQVHLSEGADPKQIMRAVRRLPSGGDAYTVRPPHRQRCIPPRGALPGHALCGS